MVDELELLQEREKQIPGTWQYTIRRYRKIPHWMLEDTGMLVTICRKTDPVQAYGTEILRGWEMPIACEKDMECDLCRQAGSKNCEHKDSHPRCAAFPF